MVGLVFERIKLILVLVGTQYQFYPCGKLPDQQRRYVIFVDLDWSPSFV